MAEILTESMSILGSAAGADAVVMTPSATPAAPDAPEPAMNAEDRVAFARGCLADPKKQPKRADLVAFVRGYLNDLVEPEPVVVAASSDVEAALAAIDRARAVHQIILVDVSTPAPDVDEARYFLPVERSPTGAVQLPPDAVRTYNRDEALALARKIVRVANAI
jgi:hypothetical protein